jgi:ethanolamine utilization protein EutA
MSPHDIGEDHEHGELTEEEKAEIAKFIWSQETVELKTVGIDIGSSTSHLLFATITLQRQTQGLSSRFVVIDRQVVWRSPIMLTPFLPNGLIDAEALGKFIHGAYQEAGLTREEIDSGAVILTGEAIKRRNARNIDELFAEEAGKFVCATAGHKLECLLAAHGSGAVAMSRTSEVPVLHVDIGGGTTKMALVDKGVVVDVAAFAVGGRLIAQDATGAYTRVDDSAIAVAKALGIKTDPKTLGVAANRERIAEKLAQILCDYVLDVPRDEVGASLQLTETLRRPVKPGMLTVSGGVAEYLVGEEGTEYGDIAKPLAKAIKAELTRRSKLPLADPGQRIRATVIGASQFTVQVSGKTIFLPDTDVLPVHNVPVVHVAMDLSGAIDPTSFGEQIRIGIDKMDLKPSARLAIAFQWQGDPEYSRLEAAGKGIIAGLGSGAKSDQMLLLMIDGDVGKTLGRLLHYELGLERKLVSVDGVQLKELDFVDIGELINPPGVVPVVIKSLLFS